MDDHMLAEVDALLERFRQALSTKLRRRARELLGEAAGGASFQVLDVLAAGRAHSPSELASLREVRTSTMTVQLDRLEAAGWVQREPGGAALGAGRVCVTITPAGRQVLERYRVLRREVLGQLCAPLSDERMAGLRAALLGIASALHCDRPAPPGQGGE